MSLEEKQEIKNRLKFLKGMFYREINTLIKKLDNDNRSEIEQKMYGIKSLRHKTFNRRKNNLSSRKYKY